MAGWREWTISLDSMHVCLHRLQPDSDTQWQEQIPESDDGGEGFFLALYVYPLPLPLYIYIPER